MKKALLIAIVLILLPCLAFCAGCSESEALTDGADLGSGDLVLKTELESYPVGVETISCTLSNSGSVEYCFGAEWSLERLENGEWVAVPFKDDVMWIETAMILPAGESTTFNIELSLLKDELSAGDYRIIKNIVGAVVSTRFTVVEQ